MMTLPVKLFNYIQYSIDPTIAAVSASTIYVAILVVVGIDLSLSGSTRSRPRVGERERQWKEHVDHERHDIPD